MQSAECLTPRFWPMRNFACVFTEKVYNNSLTKRTIFSFLYFVKRKVQNVLHLAFGQCVILPVYSLKKCTITALQNVHF